MQELMDFHKWEFHHYLVIAGIAVVLLALILYFIPGIRIKLPAIVMSSLGFLAAGLGLGMLAMAIMGYHYEDMSTQQMNAAEKSKGSGNMANMMKMKGGGKMPGGGGRGGPPSSKTELAAFVGKLDLLTSKPLAIDLADDKKTKVAQVLQGLDKQDTLSEEDAKKKLDALEDQLKDYKDTFLAVGFRWPSESGSARPPATSPNPFKDEANSRHLKALQERLSKGKAGAPAGKTDAAAQNRGN
jgi:hypothetical protein